MHPVVPESFRSPGDAGMVHLQTGILDYAVAQSNPFHPLGRKYHSLSTETGDEGPSRRLRRPIEHEFRVMSRVDAGQIEDFSVLLHGAYYKCFFQIFNSFVHFIKNRDLICYKHNLKKDLSPWERTGHVSMEAAGIQREQF